MSISSSLSNALSGLTATSRAAAVVSSNVANALTEGYGRRELAVSSRELMGVKVDGVVRIVDEVVIRDRLLADAALGNDSGRAAFYSDLERILGRVDDPASVPGRFTAFDAALIEAASRPDSQARLQALFDAATGLAEGLGQASDGVQQLRVDADAAIAADVARLNTGLADVADLNARILRARAAGQDVSSFLDQQQRAIDGIADIVPLRTVQRENGTVGLITPTGGVLLDVEPAVIGFVPRGVITPDMTLASGALSGLTINGQPVSTTGRSAPLAGGTLGAAIEVRDDLAVRAQARLDAVARDLIERFQDPAVDPTLAAGDPGLFTDGGAAFDPPNEPGLAARIGVNALVDPGAGGALWRLRDGLGAASEGPVGENGLLISLRDALNAQRTVASGGITTGARSAPALAGDLLSLVSVERQGAEARQGFSAAAQQSLRTFELENGVDTDQELQKLLLIEQAYAANARVMTTASEMIDTLLSI